MAAPCEKLELFADGELTPPEAESFRDHLATCTPCQDQLTHLLVLDRLGARYVTQQPPREKAGEQAPAASPARKHRPRWHLAVMGGVACALAAAVLLLVLRPPQPREQELPELAWNPHGRTLTTPRMSDPRADRYRPVAPQLMGGQPAREKLPWAELDQLKAHGDYRAAAAVYLAWNRPEQALDALEMLDANSPDVQSDRAAILISLQQYEEALQLLEPLLIAHPEHHQARWNRALALEALGQPLKAARDFLELARQNEEGWAQDAKARAEKLLSTVQKQKAP
jgi:tetratricopeptide (TPR) repeat protein